MPSASWTCSRRYFTVTETPRFGLAFERARFRRHGAEEGARLGMREVADIHEAPLREVGRGLHQAFGMEEKDPGLLARPRGGVDLGPRLTVHRQAQEADAGGQGRLAVALPGLHVGGAKAARAVRTLPAPETADDEHLPRLEHEGLTDRKSVV